MKAKRPVQRSIVDKDGEQGEDVEHVELSDAEQFRRMAETPVAELVAQYSDHFFRLALLDQCVIDNNVLFPRQAVEVCITVSASFAAVYDKQVCQWEVQPLC